MIELNYIYSIIFKINTAYLHYEITTVICLLHNDSQKLDIKKKSSDKGEYEIKLDNNFS